LALRVGNWEGWLPLEGPARPAFLSPPPWNLARSSWWVRLACSQLVFGLDVLLTLLAGPAVSEANDTLLYLGGAIVAALYLGRAATFLASLEFLVMLSKVHAEHPFVGPEAAWQYPLSCLLFLLTTNQIAYLSMSARRESWKDRQRGEVLELLSRFDQLCAEANTEEQVRRHLQETMASVGSQSASPFARALLTELINHANFTIERIRQTEKEHRADVLEATQKLQSAVINSLSHDLQTPLTSILGVLEALRDVNQARDVDLDEDLRLLEKEDPLDDRHHGFSVCRGRRGAEGRIGLGAGAHPAIRMRCEEPARFLQRQTG